MLDPTWQCFIDNISIGPTAPFAYPENNWLFCEQATLLDGPHILTVNATVSQNQTFWFNDIQYVPSASVPLDQAAIVIDHLDPQLQYGQGWEALGDTANMTVVPGSKFTFTFIGMQIVSPLSIIFVLTVVTSGISLSWYGFIPNELPLTPSPATYSIDGQTPINFLLKGIPANTATTYNQKFFETAQLSPGSHTLEVVYKGNNSTPLVLGSLIVQNGTLSSTTSHATTGTAAATGTAATGSGVSTPTRAKSSTPGGAIAGGVIGGLALIGLVILGFLLFRQRRKRAAHEQALVSTPQPFEYSPLHPSNITPNPSGSSGISYSPVPQTMQIGRAVTYGAKGNTYHASMPSLTTTDVSQSIEPPSTSSGTSYPTNLLPVPLQQTALAIANPSLSPPVSISSVSPPVTLPSKAEREAEALAALRPQRRGEPSVPASVQSNDTWLPSVVLHADSGIRMPSGTMEVPPVYTPD